MFIIVLTIIVLALIALLAVVFWSEA